LARSWNRNTFPVRILERLSRAIQSFTLRMEAVKYLQHVDTFLLDDWEVSKQTAI